MNSTNLPIEMESKTRVRFPDCDPFNHLNNAKYIDYIINAREDQLLQYYDFDIYKLAAETGNAWVAAQTQIAYLFPAMLMEVVTIRTRLIAYDEKSLLVEAEMWDEHKTRIKAIMWAKLVHYQLKTKKSQTHSAELMELFKKVIAPLNVQVDFEERVEALKKLYFPGSAASPEIKTTANTNYLESVIKQFEYYKMLGEKTMEQVDEEKLFWQYNEESNSIATIVKHLSGNMLSRWTDFLTTDGEKEWRNRDAEFENDLTTKAEVLKKWNEGWEVFMQTLRSLTQDDLQKIIYIRNQGHTVMEAINRQLAHYPYHVGQMVFVGKMLADKWNSLSIPRGQSNQFNAEKFSKEKQQQHFTDEFLKDKK